MEDVTYSGNRREAMLWVVLLFGPCVLGEIGTILNALGIANPLFFRYQPGSAAAWMSAVGFTGVLLVAFAMSTTLARWRGASVRLYDTRIDVTQWYGRRASYALSAPVRIDQSMTIVCPGLRRQLTLRIPFETTYRLQVGETQVYLNLDGVSDPSAEVRRMERQLGKLPAGG